MTRFISKRQDFYGARLTGKLSVPYGLAVFFCPCLSDPHATKERNVVHERTLSAETGRTLSGVRHMSRGTIVGNCGETSGTVWEKCHCRGEKKADVADFPGTVQGFSGHYSDHRRPDLCIYRRSGKLHCHYRRNHHECDSGNGADCQGGKVALQSEKAVVAYGKGAP